MRYHPEYFHDVHADLLTKIGAGVPASPSFGDISLDISSQNVCGPEVPTLFGSERLTVKLTVKEYCILWLLVRAQGGLISGDEIAYFIYEDMDEDIPLGNTTQVFVCRARKKIERVQGTVDIQMFRGIGYQLICT